MTSSHSRGVRLREAVVPDWLTEAMPPWLTEAMRSRPAPVPWGDMVRAALAVSVPLSVGIAVGRRDIALLPALGGLLGTVVDTGGPYLLRVRRVLATTVFGAAAGLAVGSVIHGRGWIAVLALVVVAAVSAVFSRLGAIGSVTGLQLLIYSSLGLGPVGALRPWWHTALGFAVGVVWALLLIVPGWLLAPRSAEQRDVAAVYHALASGLRAIGTDRVTDARVAVTAALNTAYDTMLTARSTVGGRSRPTMRLMAVLNASHPLAEAAATLRLEGNRPPPLVTDTIDRLADAIASGGRRPGVPLVPPPWSNTPGSLALRDAMAGLAHAIEWTPEAPPKPALRTALRNRVRAVLGNVRDQLRGGWLGGTFTIRLMLCVGVAGAVSEVLPLQRSYWVVLTVAIVLKPDSGSVFARAVQRGIGTVAGAVLGAVILAVVPYGPLLLIPTAVLAAGLPYGRSRNFGLLATFLTPLVVLLIDLLVPAGWRLAGERLTDTLLGCAIVLLVGYAPWPMSWHSDLPRQFAATLRDLCRYMEEALVTSWEPGQGLTGADPGAARTVSSPPGPERRSKLRRQTSRDLADLRTEYQRAMSEPRAVSRRAAAWWPAVVGLEATVDAVTGTAVAISRGAPAPSPAAVLKLTAALGAVADAIDAGVPPRAGRLPDDERLKPVVQAAHPVLALVSGSGLPPRAGGVTPVHPGDHQRTMRRASSGGQPRRTSLAI
jgi:uncharacterized membrane protein YccC